MFKTRILNRNKYIPYFFTDGANDLLPSWIDLGDVDIFQAVLEQMKKVPNMDGLALLAKQSDQSENGNTILHILAQSPTSETSLDLIMDLLQFGFNPSLKNKKGQNFLDVSIIKEHLLQRIRSAPDNWTYGLMSNWIHNSGGE